MEDRFEEIRESHSMDEDDGSHSPWPQDHPVNVALRQQHEDRRQRLIAYLDGGKQKAGVD